MSLDVSQELLAAAELGEVTDEQFADCVRTSLPYAWQMVSDLATRMHVDGTGGTGFVDNTTPPPDEQARGQLLRALASDAIRGCLERHFGVRLAFQNCHRVAVFPAGTAQDADEYRAFTSVRSQLLNQSPLLRDC
ncbi:SCO5389 family protein [Catenulispora subtropica]|uniref:SCO5389 family protein n=1 Tax=Catenulispora subtropica TaxID=450798 RepID=A0ABP5ESN3_9ACTN